MEKTFVDRLPLTVIKLTEEGRTAVEAYRARMLEVLGAFDKPE